MRKRTVVVTTAAVFILGLTAAAWAATIQVDVVSADWTNVVSTMGSGASSGVSFVNSDGLLGNEEIRWGTPMGSGQSGYRFDSAAPPQFSVATNTQFQLGDFTHFNFPIQAPSLTRAQLNISADLTINGTALAEGPFLFSFLHTETPNSGPHPDDIVNFSNVMTSSTFIVDGETLTLNMVGFQHGGVLTSTFDTVEGQSNTAQLIASFSAPQATVPEPGTLILLGSGLLGLVSRVRKKSKKQQ